MTSCNFSIFKKKQLLPIFLIYDVSFNEALQDYKQIIVVVQVGAVKIYVSGGIEEEGNKE